MQFCLSYTWSKSMDYTSGDNGALPVYRDYKTWAYGLAAFDQTHVAVINYIWDLPRASRALPNPVVKALFDNWQFSGITTLASGTPTGVGLATSENFDFRAEGMALASASPAPVSHVKDSNTLAMGSAPGVRRNPALPNGGLSVRVAHSCLFERCTVHIEVEINVQAYEFGQERHTKMRAGV